MELVGLPDIDKTEENGAELAAHGGSLTLAQKIEMIQSKLKLNQLINNDDDKINDIDNDSTNTKQSSLSASSSINEKAIDVIQVLLVATQFLGRECNEGKHATIAADLAVGLCDAMDDDDNSVDDVTLVKCHRARGVSYGLLAYQSKIIIIFLKKK